MFLCLSSYLDPKIITNMMDELKQMEREHKEKLH